MTKRAKSTTYRIGRDAKTGRFLTVNEAKKRPSTTTVERIPKSGQVSPKTAKAINKASRKYSEALSRLAKR